MATGLLHFPNTLRSKELPSFDTAAAFQRNGVEENPWTQNGPAPGQRQFLPADILAAQGEPVYGKSLRDTPLMAVLENLKQWAALVGVDWRATAPGAGRCIPLPAEIDEDDIAKVAAYSAGLKEICSMCQMVNMETPDDAFAALTALAAMVTRAHWKQQRAIMQGLPAFELQHFAQRGHPQCRIVATKLLLRLWGHEIPARDLVQLLAVEETTFYGEVSATIFRSHSHDKEQLYALATALLCLKDLGLNVCESLVNMMVHREKSEERDGAAIILAGMAYKVAARRLLFRAGAVRALVEHVPNAADERVAHVILHGLQCLCEREDGRQAVYEAGGCKTFLRVVQDFEIAGAQNARIYEQAQESVLEAVMKALHLLAHDANAILEMRTLDARETVEEALKKPEFLNSRRSRVTEHRYGVPLLNLLTQ